MSIEAKATVNVGPFVRGGSRVQVHAVDHAVQPKATVTHVSIFLREFDEPWLYGMTLNVTNRGLVDRLVL